jgi:hypothetical protein
MNFSNLYYPLKEEILGKRFVYKSKYGGDTFGKVSDLTIQNIISCDDQSGIEMVNFISTKTTKVERSDKVVKSKEKWLGTSFEIIIFSENGNQYNLSKDEIYFIEDNNFRDEDNCNI